MIAGTRGGQSDRSLDRAAALVRSMPLRWVDGDNGDDDEVVMARGWFWGADECARVLAKQASLETCEGAAFGMNWPMLARESWTIAPALPVAVGAETAIGPDGEYRRDSLGIWREARGDDELYMVIESLQTVPGRPFDLLWYGDNERFMVREGELEIEDLFGALRLPASSQQLDRLLVRSRRVDGEALAGVETNDRAGPQIIEVRRASDLSLDQRWRDALNVLAARADIESATSRGGILEARTVAGTRVVFEHEEIEEGWLLTLRGGKYLFSELRLECTSKALVVSATLGGDVDALAPGMRGRLIFDLRADLVTLD